MPAVKLYWPALLVATLAAFCFEGLWYTVFQSQWLTGVGRTREWFISQPISPGLQYAIAFLCSLIAAIFLTALLQATGPQTAARGASLGAILWLGFVATSWAKEYIFEVRSLRIFVINTGSALIGLVLIGAIVGAWKPRLRLL